MPFYRINGMSVHVKGSKRLPPPCRATVGVQTSDGQAMQICGGISGFQCDWPVGDGRTCDANLCEAHAWQLGRNRHLCPTHRAGHIYYQAQRDLFSSLL